MEVAATGDKRAQMQCYGLGTSHNCLLIIKLKFYAQSINRCHYSQFRLVLERVFQVSIKQ